MANSKIFILLGLAFVIVLLVSSEVSARNLVETTAQTQESGEVDMDGYRKGYGAGGGYGKGGGHNGKGGGYGKGGGHGKGGGGYLKGGGYGRGQGGGHVGHPGHDDEVEN